MDLEQRKLLIEKRIKWDNEYVLEKLRIFRGNNDIENIKIEEVNFILDSIDIDYEKEKEDTINNVLEKMYESKKFKMFINKDKYINKQKKIILSMIDSIKKYFSDKFEINNNYSLGYCESYSYLVTDAYKNTKIYIPLKLITTLLAAKEERYSGKVKCLYRLSGNFEELNNIRNYELIDRKYKCQQLETMNNALNKISQNVKILKYNCSKTIDKGFFGL